VARGFLQGRWPWLRPRPCGPLDGLAVAGLLAVASLSPLAIGAEVEVLALAEPASRHDASLRTLLRASPAEDAAASTRQALFTRMNGILPTRDTPRGLVAEVGGALFPGGDSRPAAGARATLARLCRLLAAHPTLRLRLESRAEPGRAGAAGARLSTARALAVRDLLVARGVPAARVVVVVLGAGASAADVGTRGTDAGEPAAPRVRLLVSGEAITPDGA
jgi:outer membrane protein OmpA-like peptidoglycan-associated protein